MHRIFYVAILLGPMHSAAFAQRDAMMELYGEAVHRYFAGDYSGADQALSTVVDAGSVDARVYFFRGLAREAMGAGGEQDFETGARLEAEGRRFVDVGFALTRVQGYMRSTIEKARLDARIAVRQQQLHAEQARMNSAESMQGPLRSKSTSPLPGEAESDPFLNEIPPSTEAPAPPAAPIVPEIDDAANPFADDRVPAVPNATQPAPPADSPFDTPIPAEGADPFGTPPTDVPPREDPFSAPATEVPPAEDPFGAPATEVPPAEDPFGPPPADSLPPEDPFSTPIGGDESPFGL